jgi:hypothetical protein
MENILISRVLQWRSQCLGITRIKNKVSECVRRISIEYDSWEENIPKLIGKMPNTVCSMKSCWWHNLNAAIFINYSNIPSDNSCRKPWLRQLVFEVFLQKNISHYKMPQKQRGTGRQTKPLTSKLNIKSIYLILRLESPCGVLLTQRMSLIIQSETYLIL